MKAISGENHVATKVRVGVNGYGVIGKRVAEAVTLQDDMELVGVSDVATDWRMHIVTRKGIELYGGRREHAQAMERAGLRVAGILDDLLRRIDVVVDCTPNKINAKNAETYRNAGVISSWRVERSTSLPAIPSSRRPTTRARSGARRRASYRMTRHRLSAR